MPRKPTEKPTGVAEGALPTAVTRPSLEFNKSNEAIGLRVVEGSLTLLNRKVFNVLVHHAQ